uniref:Tctex1 domain-containing protein 1 n=1 Tax=Xenopus tropicalis TaxID=8364 RepID=A0A6I8RM07_XENTR
MNVHKKLGEIKLSRVTFRASSRPQKDNVTQKEVSTLPSLVCPLAPRAVATLKPQQGEGAQKAADTRESASPISLKGLLAAQRITRELKNRAALRRKTRVRTQNCSPITIINEQTPANSANPAHRFPNAHVKELIEEFLATKLKNESYDPSTCAALTKDLCEDIKKIVRRVTPPRYKLICSMAIGSKDREDIMVTSQCLWDSYSDNVTSCSYQNRTLFCVVLVYAVYFE